MKIAFLPATKPDVRWFSRYYQIVFPEGSKRASAQMRRTLAVLKDNPGAGRPLDKRAGERSYAIPRTPFLLVYRISEDRIEILRLLDGRGNPEPTSSPLDE